MKSLQSTPWHIVESNNNLAQNIAQDYNLHPVLSQLLAKKIDAKEIDYQDISDYLNPYVKNLMPDPYIIHHMEQAVSMIGDALIKKKKIAFFGDYDVDGATSSALMGRYFRSLGLTEGDEFMLYIPNRDSEGYGPNKPAIKNLIEQGHQMIISLDCGIMAHEEVDYAKTLNACFIIIDHHNQSDQLPKADAIINPKCYQDKSGLDYLAAVGVSFMVCVALNRYLTEKDYFHTIKKPDLRFFLDLVALGTVADLVPLIQLNRAFVQQGLYMLNHYSYPYMEALKSFLKCDDHVTEYHLGFQIGPRINACGRMGTARLGLELLLTEDSPHALSIASQCEQYNISRQEQEKIMITHAVAQAEQQISQKPDSFLIIDNDIFHAGIIGIVASRLKDKFHLPCILISWKNDIGKASGRSIHGFDLGHAIHEAQDKGYIISGGGHKMAAGFSLKRNQLSDFFSFMQQQWTQQKNTLNPYELLIDIVVDASAVSIDFIDILYKCSPFGMANKKPIILLKNCIHHYVKIIKGQHILVEFSSHQQQYYKAMLFNGVTQKLGQALLNLAPKSHCHIACHISKNFYKNKPQIQISIIDVAQ